jgi:uncharacterized membrane protein
MLAAYPRAQGRPTLASPFRWLHLAWTDFSRHPLASMGYGAIVVALGVCVLLLGRHPLILAGAITGFLLVGPVFAAGLCELSRRWETDGVADFNASLDGLARHREAIMGFSAIMLGIGLVWFVGSYWLLQWLLGSAAQDINLALWDSASISVDPAHWLAYVAVGALLAFGVLATSLIAVPSIVDRGLGPIEAIRLSSATTFRFLPVVLLWGALIVTLVAVGFATLLVGLLLIYPLLGHASWHAYRELGQQGG